MAEIVDFGLQQHKIKMDSRYFENVLSVVAGDTGRRIEVQLLDTNGMVQDTTGLNLRLNAEIAGKATFTDATLVDAATGKYRLDLSNGMFLAPGNWQFQWQITDSAGKKLHSFAFTGNIGKNISEGGSQATNFYLNLEDLKAMQEDLVNGTIDSAVLETNIADKLTNLEEVYAPKLTEVTAQLAQTDSQIKNLISSGYFIPKEIMKIPDEIALPIDIQVIKKNIGVYETNIEPENYFPKDIAKKTYFVDKINGVNLNDGLTLATAFKSFSTAANKTDVETIMMASGFYNKDEHVLPNKNLKVKAIVGHEVIFSGDSTVSFTKHSDNVYKCSRSSASFVWDLSYKKNNVYSRMEKLQSIDAVIEKAGSFFIDTATNLVYVHTFDNREPDNNIKVTVFFQNVAVSSSAIVYLEGIKCYFTTPLSANSSGSLQPTILARDCEFSYGDASNGINVNGAKLAIFKNCKSSHNYKDGFNYHDKDGLTGVFIEIDCEGISNGKDGLSNNNGSTCHEYFQGVRINGLYTDNLGHNVADVNNTKSLNIGCVSSYAKGDGVTSGFNSENKMWLDNCFAKGSMYSLLGSSNATFYVKDSLLTGLVSGTVIES